MVYPHVVPGTFLERPNRFIALVETGGETVRAHVKNTGRCRELLVPGARVYLQSHDDSARKTAFSLIAVEKGAILINMDSQAPNKVLAEAFASSFALPGFGAPDTVRREVTAGGSRLDFLLERADRRCYVEVKGVTLEEDGAVLFPDAPTERGVRHIGELVHLKSRGTDACVFFVVQMGGVSRFAPNDRTHPAFGDALRAAAAADVAIYAWDCAVTPDSIVLGVRVPVSLSIDP